MSLEATLTALLKLSCPRVFPGFAPTNTPRPYVTYQQIGGETIRYLGNEVPSKENALMQVNVWSDTYKESKRLIQEIEASLIVATQFQASAQAAPVSDSDADLPAYMHRQDFDIWADR